MNKCKILVLMKQVLHTSNFNIFSPKNEYIIKCKYNIIENEIVKKPDFFSPRVISALCLSDLRKKTSPPIDRIPKIYWLTGLFET